MILREAAKPGGSTSPQIEMGTHSPILAGLRSAKSGCSSPDRNRPLTRVPSKSL